MAIVLAPIPSPGSPAKSVAYVAVAGGSGALDVPGNSPLVLNQANKITPTKTFSYALKHGTKTFYKGIPVVVAPALQTTLLGLGLAT